MYCLHSLGVFLLGMDDMANQDSQAPTFSSIIWEGCPSCLWPSLGWIFVPITVVTDWIMWLAYLGPGAYHSTNHWPRGWDLKEDGIQKKGGMPCWADRPIAMHHRHQVLTWRHAVLEDLLIKTVLPSSTKWQGRQPGPDKRAPWLQPQERTCITL